MAEYSSRDILLYVNAMNRTMSRKGITKEISDEFWTSEIIPILYPMWDSDRDKMETFVRYSDGVSAINKTKYQRNQKTGEYKWVSYELRLDTFLDSELLDLYEKLDAKFTEYRGLIDVDLEQQLAATFAKENIVTWTKILMVRKFLLEESDWTQVPDAPISDEDKAMWRTYRQKLRDIPQEQESIPPSSVRFPVTPDKYKQAVEEGRTDAEYLSEFSGHFYNVTQSVLSKFSSKMVTYLTLALNAGAIGEVPSLKPAIKEQNTLDEILKVIEAGGFD
jgi:hypothetical protein